MKIQNPFSDWLCEPCRKCFRFGKKPGRTGRVCPKCGEPLQRLWLFPFVRFFREMTERAKERSPAALFGVLFLTVSLALDVLGQWGFIPLMHHALMKLNFVVHEFGHLAAQFFPTPIGVASGTLFQWALPFGSIFMFIRQRDDAAACFAGCWLSVSLMHSAWYIADAREQDGDMTTSLNFWSMVRGREVRPEEAIHDWNYMLGNLGLLNWDKTLGAGMRLLAWTIAVAAVILLAIQLWYCCRSQLASKRRKRVQLDA